MRLLIPLSLGLVHYSDGSRKLYRGYKGILDQSKILQNYKNGEILCGIRNMYEDHGNKTSSWSRTNLYAPECETGTGSRFAMDCQEFSDGNELRLNGGTKSKKGEFPWQVSLRGTSSGLTFCGGVVITNQHVSEIRKVS